MKILELKLKKDVLIVDENDFDYYELFKDGIYLKLKNGDRDYIEGNFELLCKGSGLSEEIASELVDYWINMSNGGFIFENYKDNIPKKLTAKKSFISAVESKKKFWLENPIEKPKHYDLWAKYGDYTQYGKVLTEKCLKWQEAEEKTFKNPLIFVKK